MGTNIQKNKNKQRFGPVCRDVLGFKSISITARYIYSLLITYAGNKKTCWPSIKELHEVSGLSIRMITYAIAELRNTGIIKTTRKKYYNIYEIQDTQYVAQLDSRYATGCVPDTQYVASDTTIYIENKQEKEQLICDEKISSHTKCRKIFEMIFKEKTGNEYYFTGKDGKNLKQLLGKITKTAGTSENPEINFMAFLQVALNDKWLAEHLDIPTVNSQFNKIIARAGTMDKYSELKKQWGL